MLKTKAIFYNKEYIGYKVNNPNDSYVIALDIFILMFDSNDAPRIKRYLEKYNSIITQEIAFMLILIKIIL